MQTFSTNSSMSNEDFSCNSSDASSFNKRGNKARKKTSTALNSIQESYFYQQPPPKVSNKTKKSPKNKPTDIKSHIRSTEVPVDRYSRCYRTAESSEISSNNLTCSDLETASNNSYAEFRMQRKKFIKCILREDTNLMVNLIEWLQFWMIKIKIKTFLEKFTCPTWFDEHSRQT